MKQTIWQRLLPAEATKGPSKRRMLVGVGVGSICLVALLWGLDWPRMWEVLSRTSPVYFGLAILLTVISDLIRAYRWRLVLAPVKLVRSYRLFKALVIGLMANFVLPVKVGDLVRAYVVSKDEELPFVTCLSTLAVERIYDAMCVALLFGLGLVWLPSKPPWVHGFGGALLGSVTLAFSVLVTWNRRPELFRRLADRALRRAPDRWRERAARVMGDIERGLASVGHPWLLARAMAVGMISWIFLALTYYCCLRALAVEVPPPVVLVLVAALVFGFALPSLPGGTGPYQVAVVGCLSAFGVGRETAIAVSVVTLMSDLLPLVVLGLIFAGFRDRATRTTDSDQTKARGEQSGDPPDDH